MMEATEASLPSLISAAVAARLTPEYVEKEIQTRVNKLIEESIDRALRSYSDTGKLIEKTIEEALRVDRLDLPSYGATVAGILRKQIEARVSPLVAGKLAEDMDELLRLAPKEIKLSEIAAKMRQRHDGHDYGTVITVIVEQSDYGWTEVYLDESTHHEGYDAKRQCEHRISVTKEGKILSAQLRGRDLKDVNSLGWGYGLDQMIRAFYACGTIITIDEDDVVTSVGDY